MMPLGINRRETVVMAVLFLLIGVAISIDMASDFGSGLSLGHLVIEGSVVVLSAVGMSVILFNYFKTLRSLHESQTMVIQANEETEVWRRESEKFLIGLHAVLDRQFQAWNLSSAERDVAMLVLNGCSVRSISQKRFVTEKTIRTQLSSIFSKSGVSSQQEFISVFLPLFFISHTQH